METYRGTDKELCEIKKFINPDRISLADIDTDYGEADREKAREHLLLDHMNSDRIKTSEIITFNTIATKGAIRDVARALEIDLQTVSTICNSIESGDVVPDSLRKKWSKLFEYVDIVNGTIVSIGSHPCGVLISDRNIDEEVGLCTTSGSKYPVSCLYMKELDELNFVKLDELSLDNQGLINETCKSIGIPPITPDSIPLDDMDVWRDIRDDTTMIFQFESESAQRFLKKIMSDETIEKIKKVNQNLSMIKLMSFANGLIRPSCASFRDEVANGVFYDNGLKELNEFLAPEMGHVTMQETIMKFLVKFCGFTNSESDTARRCVDENTEIALCNWQTKKIKSIKIGDIVISYNTRENRFEFEKVEEIFDNGIADVYELETEGGLKIKATSSHKFLTNYGYKKLKNIKQGDTIVSGIDQIVKCITYAGKSHVYDIQVSNHHNYVANGLVCHNCIGKKDEKKLRTLLPEIESRFIEQTHKNYNVPIRKCQEVIKPFIQTILDASSYAFSWNHSDAYSCIGYISGYLRHYYPLEFVTAALNVFASKEEKTANIISFANRKGIKIRNAKFGRSRATYFFDKESSAIYKGVGSIKYMNDQVADELYELSKEKKYESFVDLILDISTKKITNARQLDILIKLDYFSDFGNSKELLRVIEIMNMFKMGTTKSIKKSSLPEGEIRGIVEKYSSGKNKDGSESKSFKILDCVAILRECCGLIMSVGIKDFSFKEKAAFQEEFLGYVSLITEKEEDKPKLYVQSIYPAKRKVDGKQFGVNIVGQSIGSGKQTRYTIFNNQIKKDGEIKKGDIIFCKRYTRDNGYFTIREYDILW